MSGENFGVYEKCGIVNGSETGLTDSVGVSG
jgi:hypothetical protein